MTTEEELLSQFQHKAVIPSSGAHYFPASVAQEILAECQLRGLAMVGIEGNRVEQDVVYSRSDMVYDLSRHRAKSWAEYVSACNREAARVLNDMVKTPGFVLWLTILGEHEWRR